MKRTLLLCGFVTMVACGSSPTAPQPTHDPQPTQTISQPEPAPEPTVPSPVPTPIPPPTVAPYQAETGWAHWYRELVPNRFEVQILGSDLQFGPLQVPILSQGDGHILAGDTTVTVDLVKTSKDRDLWTWSLSGIDGQAYGEMRR